MPNRIIENEKRLQQKCQNTSSRTVGAGFSWRVWVLSGQSFDLRFPVPLVPQQTGMSCWAAGAAMVVAWRENYSADPAQIAQAAGEWAAYSAGLHPESTAIFPIWGLTPEPQQSYSVDGLRRLLDTYGPLWVAGAVPGPHIRVVTGMYGDGSLEGTKVLINDPWQQGMTTFTLPNAGAQYEETYSQFVAETERLARQETQSFPRAIYVARSTRPRASRAQARSLSGFTRAHGTRPSYRFVPNVRALSIPVDFDVPRPVPDLKKPSPMTCWAAATAMLVSYKEGKPVSVEEAVRRAGGRYEQLLQSDAALAKTDMADYLSALGLTSQPAAELSVEQVDQMLRRFGAVWLTPDDDATFSLDARIVTGIHGDGTPSGTNLVLLDPGNGTEALVAFGRIRSIFQRQGLSNATMHLMAIHWPPDTLGAAVLHETKATGDFMDAVKSKLGSPLTSATVRSLSSSFIQPGGGGSRARHPDYCMFGVFKRAPALATAAAEVAAIDRFIGGEVLAWKPSIDDFNAIARKNGAIAGAVNTFNELMEEIRTSDQQRMNLFTYGFLTGPDFTIGLSGDPGGSGTAISPNLDTRSFDTKYIRNVVPDLMPLPLPQRGRELWLFLADRAVPAGSRLPQYLASVLGVSVFIFPDPIWYFPSTQSTPPSVVDRGFIAIGPTPDAAIPTVTEDAHGFDHRAIRFDP